ncbi:MAG: PAS domain-containing protein [Desulfobacteraceae bacterium]|nr:PAS domain-containing protein [Desulfobacteraceae bacterium]
MLEESAELEKIAYKMQFFREKAFELDTIINSSSDALFICDAKANVTRINPASERIHQIKAEQIVGKNMADLIKQGFIERSAALEVTRCKNKVSLLQTKNGRKLISTGTPVFDDKGNLIKVVVSEQDITKLDTLQRKLEKQQAKKNQIQDHLHEIQQTELEPNKIIVQSASVVKTLEQALKVSSANSSVLITGESGVGKGLVAKLIHQNSSRSNKPFIRINCGAIPESLIESELFGYEYGAFTGAQSKGKPGHLELAHSGTLFLDEIAELPLPAQVKLLRFLENGSLTRLGSSRTITVDARILAATHQNLKRMASKGEFRKDLYYRLRVIPLTVPPLRERKACILPLLRYFIDYFSKINKTKKRLSQKAIGSLMTYSYPGNVRELINICERAVVMSETEIIDLQDLPNDIVCGISNKFGQSTQWPAKMCLKQILERVERDVLMQTIEKYGNQSSAAAALGVSQPTIARRLKKYNIKE